LLEVPTLRAGVVVLRPWSFDDVPTVQAASKDPYIPQITTVPESGDELECRAYVERQWERAASGLGYSFALCAPDLAVGQLGLWPRVDHASIGYWLVPEARGRGLAAQALALVTEWAFARGIPRLELYAEPWNEASLKSARRCGFTEQGVVRAHHQAGAELRDAILMTRGRD
jgi:[ribosomal protein S5]-alanine N-acetyltransferase